MQIQMKSSSAILAIEKSPSKLSIQQLQAKMDIQQPTPRIEMNKTLPTLTIDQTEAWADMNLKGIFRLISESATEGNQAWMQYLAKTASEGGELMKIENGFGAIASQAKRNGQLPKHEFGLGFIPSPFSVKLNYQPGDVQIQFQHQKLISDITPQKPMIHYQPGSITYHLEQKNSLQFDFTT